MDRYPTDRMRVLVVWFSMLPGDTKGLIRRSRISALQPPSMARRCSAHDPRRGGRTPGLSNANRKATGRLAANVVEVELDAAPRVVVEPEGFAAPRRPRRGRLGCLTTLIESKSSHILTRRIRIASRNEAARGRSET